jgi:aspartyl-tRNA(Asn)/glutamyl-tRNA(Gln) amidotransferase subunit C
MRPMISADDVRKLARLSRVSLTDAEVEKLKTEMESIVAYVDIVQKVELPAKPEASVYFDEENVMREDGAPHEAGAFTAELLAQAPRREGDYLKVKKILP